MARKKKHPEHENHERWLISYADFITLLFAFFVVMFASSQADKQKQQQVAESVKTALEKGAQASSQKYIPKGLEDPKGTGGMNKAKDNVESAQAAAAELAPEMKMLSQALDKDIKAGKIEVHMEARGLVVSLHEGAFFGSGDDKIVPASYPSISKIATVIKDVGNPVRLEGHTDSVPIHTADFKSNWELSAARSIAMLNLLSTNYSLKRDRFGIAGYADTMPVDSNDTSEGRARNRRVDIVVLNAKAAADAKDAPTPRATPATAANQKAAAPAAVPAAKPSPVPPASASKAAKK
jgi:chemotaxis protein MotB